MKPECKKELDLVNINEYTTSDLQGVVYVIAKKHCENENDCLAYLYDKEYEKQMA